MWIARDKDGLLQLFREKPFRLEKDYCKPYQGMWDTTDDADYECWLDNNLFPNLKWEDEPIEVDLYTKEQIKEIERYAGEAAIDAFLGED